MAKDNFILSKELLHDLFEYRDGELYRKKAKAKYKKGEIVGCINKNGYKITKLKGKIYLVHRLIYLMIHGYLPTIIDHIDGNTTNNLIQNLRCATQSQNCCNSKIYRNNKTGIKGIGFNKKYNKYFARCQVNKKSKFLGFFETMEDAKKILDDFRIQNHKEFANHG